MNATELTHAQPSREVRRPRDLQPVERIALFVCGMHRDRSAELLEGLADGPRATAQGFARQVLSWDSPTRQARLTREFGLHPDAAERVEQLVVEAPPALRLAIAALMPPAWRAQFPHLSGQPVEPAPALVALARRLFREATRA